MTLELNKIYYPYVGKAPLNIGSVTRGLTIYGIGSKSQSTISAKGLAFLNLDALGNSANSVIELIGIGPAVLNINTLGNSVNSLIELNGIETEEVKLNITAINKAVTSQISFIAEANLPNIIGIRNCQIINRNTALNKALDNFISNNNLSNLNYQYITATNYLANQSNCNLVSPNNQVNNTINSQNNNYNQLINNDLISLSLFTQKINNRYCTLPPNKQLIPTQVNNIIPDSIQGLNNIAILAYTQDNAQVDCLDLIAKSKLIQKPRCYPFQGHNTNINYRDNTPTILNYIQPCGRTGAKLIINKINNRTTNSLDLTCHKPYNRIPLREVYYVKNELTLIRVSDNREIPVTNLSIPMDADSWSGEFNASIPAKYGLDLVRPNEETGDTIIVESQINGYQWRWIVENWTLNRKFRDDSITISGRGLVSLMSDRYIPARNYVEDETYTIAQLAERELIDGWLLDWQATDWSVPSGNWKYEGRAPIEAIARLANQAGAIISPHRTNQQITIKPRYSIMPWNYYNEEVVPDLIIPIDSLISQSREFKGSVESNGIYIYGTSADGILAFVKITGTSGNKLIINQQGDSLMTHINGARAYGSKILASYYQQPAITGFTIPLGGDYPLINLTNLISITEGDEDIRGCVASISISADINNVVQNVKIGKDGNSIWKKFKELLPSSPLLIATILTSDNQANTSMVSPIGGGVIKVRGSGEVGQKVFIRNGLIEGDAPNFTDNFEIDV